MRSFRHAGDLGDVVAGLPVIRFFGGGVLYLESAQYTRVPLVKANWRGLDKILLAQHYITDVREFNGEPIEFNLNDWRWQLMKSLRMGANDKKSLLAWQLDQYSIPHDQADTPWLQIEPRKVARVVINRTGTGRERKHVYQNPDFPWHYVWRKYKDDAVFVGTPDEHEAFCASCGAIPMVETKDLYEAAHVISGCDLFIGNQSVCFWLACAMFKPIVLEVWPLGANCLITRPNIVHGWNRGVGLPDL
jgi:hypothetical protein